MLRLVKRWGARLPALVAAGALGVAPAAGQALPYPGGACARTVARTVAAADKPPAGRVCEVPQRLQQIKVELAWMADSTTFPWALTTQCDGSSLIVRGEVPSADVRQQALCLARLATPLPVVDALRVRPALRSPVAAHGAADQSLRGVMGVLREVLGERARRVEVGIRAGGQVTLRGAVPSYEEKLAISARIRSVSGCTCVLNEMTVPPAVYQGRTVLPVSADGSKVVTVTGGWSQPGESPYRAARWSVAPARPQPGRPVLTQARPLTADSGTTPRPLTTFSVPLVPVAAVPVGPPAKAPVLPKAAHTQGAGAGVVPIAHIDGIVEPSPKGTALPAPIVSAPPASMPPPSRSPWAARASHLPPKPITVFAQDHRAAGKKESEETETPPEQRNPPDLRWPMVVHAEGVPPPWKRSVSKSVPPPAATLRKAPLEVPLLPASPPAVGQPFQADKTRQAGKPDLLFETVRKQVPSSKPAQKIAEHPFLAPPVAETLPVTTSKNRGIAHPSLLSSLFGKKDERRPVVSTKGSAESVSTLSMHAVPMPPKVTAAPTPKGAVADRAYVTTGMVTFDEEPSERPAPSPPKPATAPTGPEMVAATPAELQQRVLRVCGGGTRDVQVTTRPDRHWEVKVKVPTREAAQEVSMKILQQLPDMAQPHVHLAVEVTP
ncbi:MAG: BON domain-containing protein [Planctomycetes bacterium]|nr:BON domain-containing protein [Planctomycetota bacterium]